MEARPVVVIGTVACSDVDVAEVTWAEATFAVRRSFVTVESKFVPFTVTVLPATISVGEKPVRVGAAPAAVTVKLEGAFAVWPCAVTAIALVTPVAGTVTTSSVPLPHATFPGTRQL